MTLKRRRGCAGKKRALSREEASLVTSFWFLSFAERVLAAWLRNGDFSRLEDFVVSKQGAARHSGGVENVFHF